MNGTSIEVPALNIISRIITKKNVINVRNEGIYRGFRFYCLSSYINVITCLKNVKFLTTEQLNRLFRPLVSSSFGHQKILFDNYYEIMANEICLSLNNF